MQGTIYQQVDVTFDYQVCFTRGLFKTDNPLFRDAIVDEDQHAPKKLLIFIDSGVADCHPNLADEISAYCSIYAHGIDLVHTPYVIQGGEEVKEEEKYLNRIYQYVDTYGIDRHSYIAVVGGGAIIDAVGYAASVAHRGIRLIRIPTTVLSQNDSAVGVKNGVNKFGKKNFLGVFDPPYAVLSDYDFLETLPDRDWRSGTSEAVKVALLKDSAFFEYLEEHAVQINNRQQKPMEWLIYRCAELHLNHIANSGDPFETGSSRPLDFGHWVAHRLESATNYRVRHGEAVAIGIALDSTYSYLKGMLTEQEWKRIIKLFLNFGFDLYVDELSSHIDDKTHPESILNGLEEFRQHLGGKLTIMLLEEIGHGVETNEMDDDLIRRSVEILKRIDSDHTFITANGNPQAIKEAYGTK